MIRSGSVIVHKPFVLRYRSTNGSRKFALRYLRANGKTHPQWRLVRLVIGLSVFVASIAAHADRVRVLPQIDLPHDYYFREMYLPQLTTGPSAVAFSPDGTE